jgi:hypothetical protein
VLAGRPHFQVDDEKAVGCRGLRWKSKLQKRVRIVASNLTRQDQPIKTTLVSTIIAGRHYGDLVTAYSDQFGKRIACRCRCTRLVFVNIDDLESGAVTSCGCSLPSLIHRIQLRELAIQMRRVINFNLARRRT